MAEEEQAGEGAKTILSANDADIYSGPRQNARPRAIGVEPRGGLRGVTITLLMLGGRRRLVFRGGLLHLCPRLPARLCRHRGNLGKDDELSVSVFERKVVFAEALIRARFTVLSCAQRRSRRRMFGYLRGSGCTRGLYMGSRAFEPRRRRHLYSLSKKGGLINSRLFCDKRVPDEERAGELSSRR